MAEERKYTGEVMPFTLSRTITVNRAYILLKGVEYVATEYLHEAGIKVFELTDVKGKSYGTIGRTDFMNKCRPHLIFPEEDVAIAAPTKPKPAVRDKPNSREQLRLACKALDEFTKALKAQYQTRWDELKLPCNEQISIKGGAERIALQGAPLYQPTILGRDEMVCTKTDEPHQVISIQFDLNAYDNLRMLAVLENGNYDVNLPF